MVTVCRVRGKVGVFQNWLAQRSRPRLGEWGEWIALKHLLKNGYDLVGMNWKSKRGEVDLIAYDGEDLVFVEVKTRRVPSHLPPEINLDDRKKSQLEFLAHSFLARHELTGVSIRFDLIAVETPDQRNYEIRHYSGVM